MEDIPVQVSMQSAKASSAYYVHCAACCAIGSVRWGRSNMGLNYVRPVRDHHAETPLLAAMTAAIRRPAIIHDPPSHTFIYSAKAKHRSPLLVWYFDAFAPPDIPLLQHTKTSHRLYTLPSPPQLCPYTSRSHDVRSPNRSHNGDPRSSHPRRPRSRTSGRSPVYIGRTPTQRRCKALAVTHGYSRRSREEDRFFHLENLVTIICFLIMHDSSLPVILTRLLRIGHILLFTSELRYFFDGTVIGHPDGCSLSKAYSSLRDVYMVMVRRRFEVGVIMN